MAYGNGQRLGETIDPRLMQVDFSGIERAGATAGNMFANLGADIGAGMKQYGDTEKEIKKAEQIAKSIREAIPDLRPMADEALANLNNPNLSQRDRHAIAQAIGESLKIGVLGIENKRADAMMGMDMEKFNWQRDMADRELAMSMEMARNTPMKPPTVEEFGVEGGTQKMVWNGYTGEWELPRAAGQQGGDEIAPPDGVAPQGNPMGNDPQGRISLPMRQTGDDLISNEIAAMAEMTPQVGDSPNYGSIQEAMDMGSGVLPPRDWQKQPQQPAKIGFKPTEPKESDKPQEVILRDGSKAYGTFKNGVFQPAMTPDGQPMVRQEVMTPKEQAEMEIKQAELTGKKAEIAKKELDDMAKGQQFLTVLDELEKHPGFTNVYGTNFGLPTWTPGSSAANAKALQKQITAKSFLEGIQSMKGFGSLNANEGAQAANALTILNETGIDEATARKEIKKLKDIINKSMMASKENISAQTGASNQQGRTEPISSRESNAARLREKLTLPQQ